MADIRTRSLRGGAVTMAAQGGKFALQLGSTAVLARILTPADFGLIAMVTAVTGFVAMFKDAGLSMATVQRETITHDQVSTLFWINVALSIGLMALTAALAPAIAWLYGEPRLTAITLALAATFVFGGLTVQHQALLQRQMRFTALSAIDVATMAVGVAVGIAAAAAGWGYWALVGMAAAQAVANAALVWMTSGWMPGPPVRGSGVMPLLKFGGGLTGFNIINYFTRNADNVIIGVALGSGPLGIYSKAYNLLMLPIRQLNAPVGSVMLPALCRMQNDPPRYRRAYFRAITTLAFLGMPIAGFIFVAADEVVVLLLGPGWHEAADVFRWLAPAALFGAVNVAPGWLCTSLGRAKTQVVWASVAAPITVGAFLFGAQWGVNGVAAAFSATWCGLLLVFMAMACYRSPVSFSSLLRRLMEPCAAVLGATAIAVCLTFRVDTLSPISSFIFKGVSFFAIYATIAMALPSGRLLGFALWCDGLKSLTHNSKDSP